MSVSTKGLSFAPYFTVPGIDPYNTLNWELRDAHVGDYHQEGVWFPSTWSQRATDITASKYFRMIDGERENDLRDMINRVVDTLTNWGGQDGYFCGDDAYNFRMELRHILVNQLASFNSPVWFNIGVPGVSQQSSACFILNVEDDMPSILNWYTEEGMIFKGGSGSGVNVSKIRGKDAPLSNGGKASGPISFMRVADHSAGAIKSGGGTRRAAKMVILDVGHPDIEEFIWLKVREEEKSRALRAAGYEGNAIEEAQVDFQNANHSVRVSDEFMRPAALHAAVLFNQIAEAAHACGDPGLHFGDTINKWHTVPHSSSIESSNPCQPAHATVLTPQGIRTFADIDVGSIIWSGKQWTRVVRKVHTGAKPVYAYQTSTGVFVGTKEHRVLSCGERVEAQHAQTIDRCKGVPFTESTPFDGQAMVDGLMLGDGSVKHITATSPMPYMLLCVGKKDYAYFTPESGVADFITEKPFDKFFHRVKTTWEYRELGRTYNRRVPERYFYASENIKRSFLRGLYSANGSICGGRVTLKAASFDVITQVQHMLSSLGIYSYYTTNRAHDVEFKNGTYTCKESYDLNITTDKDIFLSSIGFIQPNKQARLLEICTGIVGRNQKSSYEVQSITPLGVMPVFDITVDAEEHTYWTGGLLVSNCSEFFFLNDSACNLASINLLKFLKEDNTFDIPAFRHTVDILITAQDILCGRSDYPTAAIAMNSGDFRPLGLGYTNLGATLMAQGMPYDSDEGRKFAGKVTSLMTAEAYLQSARMAEQLGAFAGYEANKEDVLNVLTMHHAANDWFDSGRVWAEATALAKQHGVRNAQVTLLAPTGTISFMMDAETTGIEPLVGLTQTKKLVGGGSLTLVSDVAQKAMRTLGCNVDNAEYDPIFQTALGSNPLPWQAHVKMVAAVQPFLSGGVSKTINMPTEATVEDVKAAYLLAWELGLKSIAIYRDGSKTVQPVCVAPHEGQPPTAESLSVEVRPTTARRRLADERQAINHKFSVDGYEGYLTVGLFENGQPGELFLRMSKEGSTLGGLCDALGVAVSLGLQYGVPLEALVEKYQQTKFEPMGMTNNPDIPIAQSIVDYIFRWLGKKFLGESAVVERNITEVRSLHVARRTNGHAPICPECGNLMVQTGTCSACPACGTSGGCA